MSKPIYTIGYARISDKKQQRGSGLENQSTSITQFNYESGWTFHPLFPQVLKEIYTGKTQERPVYQAILKFCREHRGEVKYVVIKVINRATRGGGFDYLKMKDELAKLGVELRDVNGVIRPSVNTLAHRKVRYGWSNYSPSQINEIIEAEKGSADLSNILALTVDSSIERVQAGYKLRAPNYGYKNQQIFTADGRKRTIQVPDPERQHFIKAIFELSAENVYDDKEITEHVNRLGYKSPKRNIWDSSHERVIGYTGGKPLTVKHMQELRLKPIYCGVNKETWGDMEKIEIIARTEYEGIVSIDTFNRANKGKVYIEELPGRKVAVHYNYKHYGNKRSRFRQDFIFKNVILCPTCNKPLLASYSTGKNKKKWGAYHCSRNHARYAVPKAQLEETATKFLKNIEFSDKYKNVFEKVAIAKYRQEQQKNNGLQITLNEKVVELQKKVNETLEALKVTKSPQVRNALENDYENLTTELNHTRGERDALEVTEGELQEFISNTRMLMEHPAEMLANPSNMQEQLALYSLFFEVLPTFSEIVNGTPKLRLAFKLTQSNQEEKSAMVTLQGVEPCFSA